MENLPRLTETNSAGITIMRTGYVIAMYSRQSHYALAERVIDLLSAYRDFAGPSSLLWFVNDEGDLEPLTDAAWERLLLTTQPLVSPPNHKIQLGDSPEHADGFHFDYTGFDLTSEVFSDWPHAASYLELCFGAEFVASLGLDQFRAFAASVAARVGEGYGYASPAFHAIRGAYEPDAFARIRSLCFEFPGLDVHAPNTTTFDINSSIRGSYWLNFLGSDVLEHCGGPAGLRPLARLPGVEIEDLGDGALTSISLSTEPLSGGPLSPLSEAYLQFAELFRPRLHKPWFPLPSFSPDDMERWRTRHLRR